MRNLGFYRRQDSVAKYSKTVEEGPEVADDEGPDFLCHCALANLWYLYFSITILIMNTMIIMYAL